MVLLAVARARFGRLAAIGLFGPRVVLDPAAAEAFVLQGLELLQPAAFDRAETLKSHRIPQ